MAEIQFVDSFVFFSARNVLTLDKGFLLIVSPYGRSVLTITVLDWSSVLKMMAEIGLKSWPWDGDFSMTLSFALNHFDIAVIYRRAGSI